MTGPPRDNATWMAEARAFEASKPSFRDWALSPYGGAFAAIKTFADGRYAGIRPLLFTWSLCVGLVDDRDGIEDRYCYGSERAARDGLRLWDGRGEPRGWHRNPRTGRRRPDGKEENEYVDY